MASHMNLLDAIRFTIEGGVEQSYTLTRGFEIADVIINGASAADTNTLRLLRAPASDTSTFSAVTTDTVNTLANRVVYATRIEPGQTTCVKGDVLKVAAATGSPDGDVVVEVIPTTWI